MPIDFFEKEVEKSEEKFNQTYGVMVVCNLKLRQAAILSIISLGLLCRKITAVKRKHEMKDDIQTFMRIRNTLNNHFNQLIDRRRHETNTRHPETAPIKLASGASDISAPKKPPSLINI
jgi:hypothetical protein